MKTQKHVWIAVLDGVVSHDAYGGSHTEAFLTRSAARNSISTGDGWSIVKYVPENKSLVRAAKEALGVLRKLMHVSQSFLVPYGLFSFELDDKEAILILEKALEAK